MTATVADAAADQLVVPSAPEWAVGGPALVATLTAAFRPHAAGHVVPPGGAAPGVLGSRAPPRG